METRRVVVSGMGAVSPYGIGVPAFWDNIAAGKSAAMLIDLFDASGLPTRFAAQLPLSDQELGQHVENQKMLKTLSRSGRMLVIAAAQAVADARLDTSNMNPYRVGMSIGAGGVGLWDNDHSSNLLSVLLDSLETGDEVRLNRERLWLNFAHHIHPLTPLKGLPNVPTAQVAIMTNARGNCHTTTTACTSSAQAIGEAYRQIKHGIADVVIAGGSDSMVNPYGLVAFGTLGVMSSNNEEWQTAARPFDRRRDGFMIGEGAAVVVIEELEHCFRRKGTPCAEIIGYASTCDAYRLTDEPPEAWGSIEAMRFALEDAGLAPESVDYINAHGTGTQMNDRTETHAIKSVFGEHAGRIPVSSTKSMIGHLVAAAGSMEFVTSVLAMKHGVIPPTINYEERDDNCDLDYVTNGARRQSLDVVLSNSFGFGGQNACLIVRTQQRDGKEL